MEAERLRRLSRLARRALASAGVLLIVIYAADSLRAWSMPGGAGLGSVTFYIAVPLKSGRTEIYYDQPQTEVCVHALFPHFGYRPCWYAARDRVHAG